jgi:hypothetical protein
MSDADPKGLLARRLRCRHCEDVIGTYEPLVLVTDSGHYHTSLAASPELYETEHVSYHGACFEKLFGK